MENGDRRREEFKYYRQVLISPCLKRGELENILNVAEAYTQIHAAIVLSINIILMHEIVRKVVGILSQFGAIVKLALKCSNYHKN